MSTRTLKNVTRPELKRAFALIPTTPSEVRWAKRAIKAEAEVERLKAENLKLHGMLGRMCGNA